MGSWASLKKELDTWSSAGRVADLWIRDDDAVSDTPQVRRLLEATVDAPVTLAVIPARADETLVELVASAPRVSIWQHGWQHRNWAAHGNSEYPASRSAADVEDEISRGYDALLRLFGPRAGKIFVPPWSGFDERFFPVLERLGYEGYSGFEPRGSRHSSNVRIVNTHCEIIEWATPPWFAGEDKYIDDLVHHLAGRRTGRFDHDECTGVLTHHKYQDERSYRFLSKLIGVVNRHRGARWRNPLDNSPEPTREGWSVRGLMRKTFARGLRQAL